MGGLIGPGQWHRSPSWSPDGSQILFYTIPYINQPLKKMHVIRADRTGKRYLSQDSVEVAEWSPDSSQIAAIGRDDEGNRVVYTMSPELSDKKIIAKAMGQELYAAEELEDLTPTPTPAIPSTTEAQAPPDVEDHCPIKHHRALNPSHFIKWTPDGSQVIFNHGSRIYAARTDGTEVNLLAETGWEPEQEKKFWRDPKTPGTYADISPDGKMLAYSACRASPGITENSEIEVLDLGTGKTTRITKTLDYEGFPEWSPDGRQIAFVY